MFAVLSCFLSNIPAAALAADKLQQAVTQRVEGLASTQTPGPITSWYGLPVITWQQADQYIAQGKKDQAQIQQDLSELAGVKVQLTKAQWMQRKVEMQPQQGTLNYAEVTKGKKYIFISELHEVAPVQAEVQQILKAVRAKNPGKKILLATEFASLQHPQSNPLQLNNRSSLHDYGYDWIPDTADKLKIDVLALDDEIVQFLADGTTLVKVGEQYLRTNVETDPRSVQILQRFPDDFKGPFPSKPGIENTCAFEVLHKKAPAAFKAVTAQQIKEATAAIAPNPGDEKWYAVYMNCVKTSRATQVSQADLKRLLKAQYVGREILGSYWGIIQRNKQWANRINQVAPNYDIVIVWAGGAHVDNPDSWPSTDVLLNQAENSVYFSVNLTTAGLEAHRSQIQRYISFYENVNMRNSSATLDQIIAKQRNTHQSMFPSINPDRPFFVNQTISVGLQIPAELEDSSQTALLQHLVTYGKSLQEKLNTTVCTKQQFPAAEPSTYYVFVQ